MEDQTKGMYDLCKISFQVRVSRGKNGGNILQGRLIDQRLAFLRVCKIHDFLSK